MKRTIYWIIGIIVVIGLLWLIARSVKPTVDTTPMPTPTSTNGGVVTSTNGGTTSTNGGVTTSTQGVTSVRVAVLRDWQTGTTGTQRGCDEVVMITRAVTSTQAPLAAAMNELFSLNAQRVPTGTFSFIDKSNDAAPGLNRRALSFDRATLEDSIAKIYLKGDVVYAGVCDDPRLRAQIEETAKQFTTVNRVEIYLNDKLYEDPSGRG